MYVKRYFIILFIDSPYVERTLNFWNGERVRLLLLPFLLRCFWWRELSSLTVTFWWSSFVSFRGIHFRARLFVIWAICCLYSCSINPPSFTELGTSAVLVELISPSSSHSRWDSLIMIKHYSFKRTSDTKIWTLAWENYFKPSYLHTKNVCITYTSIRVCIMCTHAHIMLERVRVYIICLLYTSRCV